MLLACSKTFHVTIRYDVLHARPSFRNKTKTASSSSSSSFVVIYVHRNRKAHEGRANGGAEEGDYTPIAIHCHHHSDSRIKMGSDEMFF